MELPRLVIVSPAQLHVEAHPPFSCATGLLSSKLHLSRIFEKKKDGYKNNPRALSASAATTKPTYSSQRLFNAPTSSA